MNNEPLRRLIDAGFTPEELESIATALNFAVIAAGETGRSYRLEMDEGLSPEKREALHAALKEWLANRGDESNA